MNSYRLTRHVIAMSAAALTMTITDAGLGQGFAQGKLDARYSVTLAGLPIGQGTWIIDIGEDSFTAAASGATSGLMRVFASGQGQSASRGGVAGGQLIPSRTRSTAWKTRSPRPTGGVCRTR